MTRPSRAHGHRLRSEYARKASLLTPPRTAPSAGRARGFAWAPTLKPVFLLLFGCAEAPESVRFLVDRSFCSMPVPRSRNSLARAGRINPEPCSSLRRREAGAAIAMITSRVG